MRGREAQGGLVQEEEAGPGHEGPTDGEHLLLSAGEGPRSLAPPFLQAGEEGVDPLEVRLKVLPPPKAGEAPEEEVVLHG